MRRRLDAAMRVDLGVLLALAVMGTLIGVAVVHLPSVVGAYLDDGIYLVTGRALATGHGYRHLELPGEPLQTKYPPLYPVLLSVVWRVFPDFPANVPAFQILNVALWALGSWLAYRLMRRAWGIPWWLATAGSVLAFGNAMTLTVLRTPFSEPLYLVVSMGALLGAVGPATDATTPPRRGLTRGVLGGLLAAASYLTRSAGLAAIPALLVDALVRRRWKTLVATAIIAAAGAGGWQVWRRAAAVTNARSAPVEALRYDLDYSAWLPADVRTLARVVGHNVVALGLSVFEEVVQPPAGVVDRLLRSGPRAALPVYVGMGGVAALLLVGLAITFRRSAPAAHLYLLGYAGLVLVWPYPPTRLLTPILPLGLTLVLAGLAEVIRRAAVLLAGPEQAGAAPAPNVSSALPPEWRPGATGVGAAFRIVAVCVLLLAYARGQPLLRPDETQLLERHGLAEAEQQRAALATLLREATPADAIVSARYGGYLYLCTGRKTVPVVPGDNPIPMTYPADRPWWGCGRVITPQMLDADRRFAEERLWEHLNATGATHVVPVENRETYYWQAFQRLRLRNPGALRQIGGTGPYELYAIDGPLRPAL